MEKACTKCGISKDIEAGFSVKGKGNKKHAWCKQCFREYSKTHYNINKPYYSEKANITKRRLVELTNELKKGPCVDCKGVFNPWQMDWDHVKETKEFHVSRGTRKGSEKKLLEEIAKCDLVCANCHRQRTHDRSMDHNEASKTALIQ
jgi:hypothetical protein